jgi:hypothetical protein
MKLLVSMMVVACFCHAGLAQDSQAPPESSHVTDGNVLILLGEKFGVNLTEAPDGTSVAATYQPDVKKADLVLSFKKENSLMLLTIENRSSHWLAYEAHMKVPKRDGFYKTSVLPIGPHLMNFESWPHPIVELMLRNFQFSDTYPKGEHPR